MVTAPDGTVSAFVGRLLRCRRTFRKCKMRQECAALPRRRRDPTEITIDFKRMTPPIGYRAVNGRGKIAAFDPIQIESCALRRPREMF
jgi:hypothetical protein